MAQVFRAWEVTKDEMRKLRNPKFSLKADEQCCAQRARDNKKGKFLVMGHKPDKKKGSGLSVNFIMPWTKSKEIKRARRMFKSLNCDDLKETSQKMIVDTFAPRKGVSRKKKGEKRRRRAEERGTQLTRKIKRRNGKKTASIWDGIRT